MPNHSIKSDRDSTTLHNCRLCSPLGSREDMEAITFRLARSDEAQQLTELAFASKRYWGYSDALIELWRCDLDFSPESIRAWTVFIAEQAGCFVGVFAVSKSGGTAELEALWVHPSCVGRGLGRALFHKAVAEARAQGATSLVIKSDPNAEPFYIRMGASSAGSVPSTPIGRRLPRLIFELGGRVAV